MKKTLAAGVLATLALLLAGCGSNDDAAAAAISDSIMKEQKSGGSTSDVLSMKKKDADCIGKGFVDKIGTDQLQTYGLLSKDNKTTKKSVDNIKMSKDDATSATDVLFGCTDVEGMMKKAMASSGQIPAAMKTCVDKVLTEENLRTLFEGIFSGDQAGAQKTLVQPMMKCAAGNQG